MPEHTATERSTTNSSTDNNAGSHGAPKPLAGIRVIELARVLAGPWACQIMADLGADVIKIEHPDGDDTRHWGPPFIEGADGRNLSAAYYHAANRGKRSIIADYRTPEGRDLVRRLVATADVVVENFKVGGLEKYGLDARSLQEVNPALIYCSITGFGQDGPYAQFAGYDFIVQGMSGIMSVTGVPDGEPMKSGVAIADLFTGVYAVVAIEAALIERAKTGRGRVIDMALLDVMAGVLANQGMNYLASGRNPRRVGNSHVNIAPYQVIEVADGHIILAVGNDGQFARLCGILGLAALAGDPRFATNESRLRNHAELTALLKAETQGWNRDALLHACKAQGVPSGPINSISQMFADPQVVHRGLRVDSPDAEGNLIPGMRTPIVMDGMAVDSGMPSPRLGEHGADVLAELERIERGGARKP
jgi:crotonobetainyl-CoA:carnitine CoA-transferase CaiB-like acyl-CoA transferase